MQKIKRNKTLDGLLMDTISLHMHIHEQMYTFDDILENMMAAYKTCETKDYIVTSAEAENIISALKSMPGFSIEKFMTIFSVVGANSVLGGYGILAKTLSVIYYIFLITNPELFENEPLFNPDGNYASEFIKEKLKKENPND